MTFDQAVEMWVLGLSPWSYLSARRRDSEAEHDHAEIAAWVLEGAFPGAVSWELPCPTCGDAREWACGMCGARGTHRPLDADGYPDSWSDGADESCEPCGGGGIITCPTCCDGQLDDDDDDDAEPGSTCSGCSGSGFQTDREGGDVTRCIDEIPSCRSCGGSGLASDYGWRELDGF